MEEMFYYATSFDKNISGWDVGNVNTWTNIFEGGCPIQENYKPPKFR